MERDRVRAGLAAPAWAVGLVALSRLDAAAAVLPSLGVLRGPLGIVLLGLGLAVGAATLLGRRVSFSSPRRGALFLVSSAVLVGTGQHYAGGLRVSGDEPHYLLMAQSLWREGDLDLRDNFERGDFREYLPALPAPHYAAPRADGRPFPAHSAGLPALLAPAYALGGRRACLVLLAFAAAALALEVRRLAEGLTGDPRAALWAWAATLGPPALFYSFHLYTEVPAALALAASLRILLGAPGPGSAVAAAALAAALPWLHLKMLPAAAVLGLVAVLRLEGRSRGAFVAAAGLLAAAFLAYHAWVFGTPTPLAVYGGVPRDMDGRPLVAVCGLLLDRSFGLLPAAPSFLLGLAGAASLARKPGREVLPHLAVGLAVLAPLLTWRMWWGGQCPPARFLVPAVPLLSLALAARLSGAPTGLVRWRWALLGLGAALAAFMVARPESMLLLNRRDRPTRVWDALSPEDGTQAARYLPSLVAGDPAEWRVAALWLAALGVVLLLDRLAAERAAVDRLFRGLGLPVALALAIGVGVDHWARRGDADRSPADQFDRRGAQGLSRTGS